MSKKVSLFNICSVAFLLFGNKSVLNACALCYVLAGTKVFVHTGPQNMFRESGDGRHGIWEVVDKEFA